MSDVTTLPPIPIPDEGKAALEKLEAQVAGLKAMIPGAKAAGMDTDTMQKSVDALEATMAALRSLPGAR